jgi:aldehyde:ferredoxin oxidoreductase
MGPDSVVAAIGQAGENLVPLSVVMNSVSHSAGGVGAVMGAKNLKASGVQGSGCVRIAGDKTEWERLVKFHLSILGGNNQHVVPSFPHPQSEYYNPNSRWVGAPGRRWGKADPPVEINGGLYDLKRIGERIFVLHRALTIRDMGEKDMRTRHDLAPQQWIYQDPNGAQPFSKGTLRMDPQDIAKAMELFYEVMGWDKSTGAPTAEAYARLGLQSVAQGLAAKKLVPGTKG